MIPAPFPKSLDFIAVSCGFSHSMVLTKNSEIIGWGENRSAQLGLGHTNNNQFETTTPTKIPLKNVIGIFCGDSSSYALTKEDGLFGWGDNSQGQFFFEIIYY